MKKKRKAKNGGELVYLHTFINRQPFMTKLQEIVLFLRKKIRFVDTLIANTLDVFKEHATSP